jgi:hypothetical protein
MDAISKARNINVCKNNITVGSVEVQLSPLFSEFLQTNDQQKFLSARELYCEAKAAAQSETETLPTITKKQLVFAVSKKLLQKKAEALIQKEITKKIENLIGKQSKKTKKAIKLAKDTVGLDATKIVLKQQKALQKFIQAQAKAAFKKNADTFTYPIEPPVEQSSPTSTTIPKIPTVTSNEL